MQETIAYAPMERLDVNSPGDIPSDYLRGLYEYWRTKAGSRCCPARGDVRPEEMVPWLGSISLLDVIDGGDDMIYRLVGTDIVAACGMEFRDRRLSEVNWGSRRDAILAEYRYVARTARPLLVRSQLFSKDRLFQTRMVPRLMLPLSENGKTPDKLLTCFDLSKNA